LRPRLRVPLLAALLVVVLAVLDGLNGDDTIIVPLYVLGPLLAAMTATPRVTAAVAVLASVLGAVVLAVQTEMSAGQDLVRLATVVLGSALAVWIAALRTRLQSTVALLDVVFERAPIGLGLLGIDLRYVRVNDRLAEINGIPAAAHVGRTIAELLPDLPPQVAADVARVARSGEPLIEVEVVGATQAAGRDRQFLASYWPVRAGGDAVTGVGIVVIDVTERRLAERALREQTDRYEALLVALSDAGEGLVVLERDGRCVFANSAFEQLCGYTFPELAAMESALDIVVEYEREDVRRRAAARLDQGLVTPSLPLTVRRRDGELVDVEVGGVRLDVGDRRQMVVVVRDVSARRRAEAARERLLARSALLAEASELFDQSLDETETLGSVAQLCVHGPAATCVILLGSEPADVHRVAAAEREAGREGELLTLLERADEHPMDAVMRSGEGVVTAQAVVVPLLARGRVHGILAAGFDRAPEADDLLLFEDLGRRAALALDSARLYAERDHVARTLQSSLLPRELPEIPGVELAARYLAAGAGNEVGGDFYDCFPTGSGDWALVIGDVCGKGAEAAALTALARYTVRAAALRTRSPSAVLAQLNAALLRDRLDYRFCTVLYASLTPHGDGVSACVSAGGHPLPLVLRAGGAVETAGTPGSLLGIVDPPELAEHRLELRAGDALVMFTDGVTEADRASGPERLSAVLAEWTGAGAADVAAAVERDALAAAGGLARDDVAVVVARACAGAAGPFAGRNQGVATAT
jgi:PAS domain S-box-containing protein